MEKSLEVFKMDEIKVDDIVKKIELKQKEIEKLSKEAYKEAKSVLKKKSVPLSTRLKLYNKLPEEVYDHYSWLLDSNKFPASRVWIENCDGHMRHRTVNLEWMVEESLSFAKDLEDAGVKNLFRLSEEKYNELLKDEQWKPEYEEFMNDINIAHEWMSKGVGSFVYDW